jgi:hypothetical protein
MRVQLTPRRLTASGGEIWTTEEIVVDISISCHTFQFRPLLKDWTQNDDVDIGDGHS